MTPGRTPPARKTLKPGQSAGYQAHIGTTECRQQCRPRAQIISSSRPGPPRTARPTSRLPPITAGMSRTVPAPASAPPCKAAATSPRRRRRFLGCAEQHDQALRRRHRRPALHHPARRASDQHRAPQFAAFTASYLIAFLPDRRRPMHCRCPDDHREPPAGRDHYGLVKGKSQLPGRVSPPMWARSSPE